eukprot:TRINITY_DN462_c0_g7_i1.p1 TRINITY_DN462_c0_g7~~TRINITY_DN462_c0_g7_i1.p1  ORF type:complete len:323 (-),score=26.31 TRINITY_DN462_c0_g7_i1:452-1420(-)
MRRQQPCYSCRCLRLIYRVMAPVRSKRRMQGNGEKAKVAGGLCLLGLVACSALGFLGGHAAAFMTVGPTGATPLASAPPSSVTPPFAATSYTSAQTNVSNTALAACLVLAAVAATRSACAVKLSSSRKASHRAVVRCATPLVATASSKPFEPPVALQPSSTSSPLLDLTQLPSSTPTIGCGWSAAPTCEPAVQIPLTAAHATDAHATPADDTAAEATAAFVGARAARVIGGVRFSASRSHKQRKQKAIRCYARQNFGEVVTLEASYDPSKLSAEMQAGLQVASCLRKIYSRERKNSVACRTGGSFSGVNLESLYISKKRIDN